MSDLSGNANFLKYHYSSEDSLMDKDHLKNKSFDKLYDRICALMVIPFGLQCAQIYYINIPEKLALYNKIRFLKIVTLTGAVACSYYEMNKFDAYWTFLNRFYPEPT